MRLVPLSYNLRSLFVRRSATLLTIVSIGATVAVLAGVLSLQQGFQTLFRDAGSPDVAIFLRAGAINEGVSGITRDRARTIIKSVNDIAVDAENQPIAGAEIFSAVRLPKHDGGDTNVPIRGVEPATFAVHGERLRIVEGALFRRGTDEVIVGSKARDRIPGCNVGDEIQINLTPFRVTGIFESDSPYASEIWGDVERMCEALDLPVYNRVIARLRPGVDMTEFAERMEEHPEVPSKVLSEQQFFRELTKFLTAMLYGLGGLLGIVMGLAAVFTATNTMQAALAARAHEIGILLSVGFRPFSVFLSFLFEALLLGLAGGLLGAVLSLPLNGIETGTTNFDTFTEVAFAFRITPQVLTTAIVFSLLLGLFGGALPAWRAARLDPVDALRRR